jgi:hypothetical protein
VHKIFDKKFMNMIEHLYNSLYGTWKELNEREVNWKFTTPPRPRQSGVYTMHKKDKTIGTGVFLITMVDEQLQVTLKGEYVYNLFINADGKEMTWTNNEEVRHFVLQ